MTTPVTREMSQPERLASDTSDKSQALLLYLVYFIYFFCGLTQCFESVFLPEIKTFFHLDYQQQMYVVFAKNVPFLLAILIGSFVMRFGYEACLGFAMVLFSSGTLLLVPALKSGQYLLMLTGFFVIGLGFTLQMVAGNPLLRNLGPAGETSSRLNLANSLGAIAQIIAPATLSLIIPAATVAVSDKLPYMDRLFVVLGLILATISVFVFVAPANNHPADSSNGHEQATWRALWNMFADARQATGFVTIFLTLGMEATLFSMFRNYVEEPSVAGLSSHQSERLFAVYFAGFALGRLSASWLQKRIRPSTNLIVYLLGALVCLCGVILLHGMLAVISVTLLGFFVSIFFPTLYAIYLDESPTVAALSSGLLTTGFLGCAIIPVIQGKLADSFGLKRSYLFGVAIYLFVLWMAIKCLYRDMKSGV